MNVGLGVPAGIIFLASFICASLVYYFFITYSMKLFAWRVRNWTPEEHQKKNGTPSMGGLVMLAIVMLVLAYSAFFNVYIRILLFCLATFGSIGLIDDYAKVTQTEGISARAKFLLQLCAGIFSAFLLYYTLPSAQFIVVPFFNISYHIGWLFIPWAMFLLVSVSNAVNLTDGLDGLAGMSCMINIATYTALACMLASTIDMCVVTAIVYTGAALGGSLLAFLWYNLYPAQVMMGDVGALSLGAVLACFALLLRQELLLPLTGAIFAAETLSVIVQVAWYKKFKTRFFKRAPLHHHFELLGWSEPKVTARFTIISLMMCLFALVISMC